MEWFNSIIKAIGGIVTTRTSVFTPLLKLNTLVLTLSVVVYWKSVDLIVFIPSLILLVYTIYRHEHFSLKMPHMLSSEKIQKYGMDLNMGSNVNLRAESAVDSMHPVRNPELEAGEVIDSQPVQSKNERKRKR